MTRIPEFKKVGRTMIVFVKMLTGQTVSLDVDQNDNIGGIKVMLQNKQGIPPDQQK